MEQQVRIGVSGAHGTGKTTLIEDLCDYIPGLTPIEEPYVLLEAEGYAFEHPPSAMDYLAQLHCSVQSLGALDPQVVFDRTPLDLLAYLMALGVNIDSVAEDPAVRGALAGLDLLVIVPLTRDIQRVLPTPEHRNLQVAMDDALLDLVTDDPFDLCRGVRTMVLRVPLDARVAAVLAALPQL